MALNPTWVDTLSYPGFDLRRVDALMSMSNGANVGALSGIRPGGGGYTTTLAGSTISVSAGVAFVYFSGQGMYRAAMNSTWTGTLNAADATYTRIDLVYLRVWDNSVDGSGLNKTDVVYLPGTPSASPSAPTPSGTQIYMPLATITVPAVGGGSASVSTAVRPVTVAPGGILPTSTAPSTPYTGQYYDDGTNLLRYNGSSWDTYQKQVTTGWTQPTLATGYSHNGNSNGNAQYRLITIEGTQFVEWSGGVGITYSSNALQHGGDFLNTPLAAAYRPASLRSLTVACSASSSSSLSVKVDFNTDGTTQIVGPTTSSSDTYATPIIRPPWISLNGVRYRVS